MLKYAKLVERKTNWAEVKLRLVERDYFKVFSETSSFLCQEAQV